MFTAGDLALPSGGSLTCLLSRPLAASSRAQKAQSPAGAAPHQRGQITGQIPDSPEFFTVFFCRPGAPISGLLFLVLALRRAGRA